MMSSEFLPVSIWLLKISLKLAGNNFHPRFNKKGKKVGDEGIAKPFQQQALWAAGRCVYSPAQK